MARKVFISLPVADVERSTAFYTAVGAVRDPRFSGADAACMTFSDAIHVMLMSHDKWRHFTTKPIVDARTQVQAFFCITAESKAEVIACVARAVAAGGAADPSPVDDDEFMYGRSFEDPDGHMWGVNWLNFPMPQPSGTEAKV